MKMSATDHLTDEQFTAYVLGSKLDAAVGSHLQACEACRAEVADFGLSVGTFNTVSLAWSESRPSISLRARAGSFRSSPGFAVASWVFAACLLVLFTVPLTRHFSQDSTAHEQAWVQPDSQAQIEQDNRFLMAVDQEISAAPRSPVEEYGMAVAATNKANGPQRSRYE